MMTATFEYSCSLACPLDKLSRSARERRIETIHVFFVYCWFGNFRENFIFANSIKRHMSDMKSSRLRQDLPISIIEIVILPFREGFIFTKLCIFSRK